jgi:hypothetical protein
MGKEYLEKIAPGSTVQIWLLPVPYSTQTAFGTAQVLAVVINRSLL